MVTAEQLDPAADLVLELHARIREAVLGLRDSQDAGELAKVIHATAGDESFAIDIPAEEIVRSFLSAGFLGSRVLVIAEGIGSLMLPDDEGEPAYTLLVDGVDGSRELAYDKRSAWTLTGVAEGRARSLADITLAVQSELPTSLQRISRVLVARRGMGASERRWNLDTHEWVGPPRPLSSSVATSILRGFTSWSAFFPGARQLLGRIADVVIERVLGATQKGQALTFEDTYISTGGQLFLLASGRYRFVADLRPTSDEIEPMRASGLAAHPYDLAASLIATEAGAIVVRPGGHPLDYPLDTETGCAWVGYANPSIRAEVEPHLQDVLRSMGVPV